MSIKQITILFPLVVKVNPAVTEETLTIIISKGFERKGADGQLFFVIKSCSKLLRFSSSQIV